MKKINFNNTNILFAYYFVFAFTIVLVGMLRPALNWDMIGYVAAAKHFEIMGIVELHQFVFENLKNFVTPDEYFLLTDGNSQYVIDMATKPELFTQQLPFYEIRPLYTLSILLISKFGVNIFAATYVMSLFSTVLGIFLLLLTFKSKIHMGLLYILPFFLMFFGILSTAKLSTPDAMVFLSLSIFIYLFSKEKVMPLLIIIPIFVLVRTDMIIFNFIALVIISFLYKDCIVKSFLSFLMTIALYLFINHYFHNYGWSTIFSMTLLERVSNPADVNFTVSVIDYIHAFTRGVYTSLDDRAFLGFISVVASSLILMRTFTKSFSDNKEIWAYTVIPILYVAIHFVLFPVPWDRFFIGFYIMASIAMLLLFSQLIKKYG